MAYEMIMERERAVAQSGDGLKAVGLSLDGPPCHATLYDNGDLRLRMRWTELRDWVASEDAAPHVAKVTASVPNHNANDWAERGERRACWSGAASNEEAVRFAYAGFPTACDAARRISAPIIASVVREIPVEDQRWSPEEGEIEMGAYLAGVPECRQETISAMRPSQGPLVRLGINLAASSSTDVDVMVRRGALVLALVQTLQAAGRDVEVLVYQGVYGNQKHYQTETQVLAPGEYVNEADLAFVLCHPSMLRRISFAVEQAVDDAGGPRVGAPSYGNPVGLTPDHGSDWIAPHILSGRPMSEAEMESMVRKTLEEIGVHLDTGVDSRPL